MKPDVVGTQDGADGGWSRSASRRVAPELVWVHLLVVLEGTGPVRSARVADTLPRLSRTAVYDALLALVAGGLAQRTAPGDFLAVEDWREHIRTGDCPHELAPDAWGRLVAHVASLERGGREAGANAILPPDATLGGSLADELEVLHATYRGFTLEPPA